MTTSHTPTPWTCDDCLDAHDFSSIRRADGSKHGDTSENIIATIYEQDDAAIIVRAVNAHEALVAALEVAFISFGHQGGNTLGNQFRGEWEQCRAALRLARREG